MRKGSRKNPRLDLNSPRVALYDGELRIFSSSFLTKFKFLPFTFSLTNIYLEIRPMKFWFYFVFGYTKPSFIQRSNKIARRSSPSLIFRNTTGENIGQKWKNILAKYFFDWFDCRFHWGWSPVPFATFVDIKIFTMGGKQSFCFCSFWTLFQKTFVAWQLLQTILLEWLQFFDWAHEGHILVGGCTL